MIYNASQSVPVGGGSFYIKFKNGKYAWYKPTKLTHISKDQYFRTKTEETERREFQSYDNLQIASKSPIITMTNNIIIAFISQIRSGCSNDLDCIQVEIYIMTIIISTRSSSHNAILEYLEYVIITIQME